MAIKQTGKWQAMITDKTGKQQLITLDEVCYVPDLKYNLMSLTKALKNIRQQSTTITGLQ
jgi:hypothetical protein